MNLGVRVRLGNRGGGADSPSVSDGRLGMTVGPTCGAHASAAAGGGRGRCGLRAAAGPLLGRAGVGRGEGCGALGRESAQVGALLFPFF